MAGATVSEASAILAGSGGSGAAISNPITSPAWHVVCVHTRLHAAVVGTLHRGARDDKAMRFNYICHAVTAHFPDHKLKQRWMIHCCLWQIRPITLGEEIYAGKHIPFIVVRPWQTALHRLSVPQRRQRSRQTRGKTAKYVKVVLFYH